MLVLSRRRDESIEIEGGIKITVVRIHDGTVRLGIDAPANTKILRSELKEGRHLTPPDEAA